MAGSPIRLQGKISWFGGPHDSTDSGHTASGGTTREPGIAVFNHQTLGGYWRVRLPNGRSAVVRQTDIGPAPWTGRKLDFTYSVLPHLGYSEHDFPTDAEASAEYLGKNAPQGSAVATGGGGLRGLVGGGQSEGGAPNPAALEALIAQMAGAGKPAGPTITPLAAPAQAAAPSLPEGFHLPAPEAAPQQKTDPTALLTALAAAQGTVPGSGLGRGSGAGLSGPVSAGPGGGSRVEQLHGVTHFGGRPVAAWIAPILQYAQAHGWKGTVTSGYRSLAEQERIYASGVRPAAKPGTSNHEFTSFPGGAVDATEAAVLSRILAQSPYRGVLVWAGSKDPVHFSHPHGGSY